MYTHFQSLPHYQVIGLERYGMSSVEFRHVWPGTTPGCIRFLLLYLVLLHVVIARRYGWSGKFEWILQQKYLLIYTQDRARSYVVMWNVTMRYHHEGCGFQQSHWGREHALNYTGSCIKQNYNGNVAPHQSLWNDLGVCVFYDCQVSNNFMRNKIISFYIR